MPRNRSTLTLYLNDPINFLNKVGPTFSSQSRNSFVSHTHLSWCYCRIAIHHIEFIQNFTLQETLPFVRDFDRGMKPLANLTRHMPRKTPGKLPKPFSGPLTFDRDEPFTKGQDPWLFLTLKMKLEMADIF